MERLTRKIDDKVYYSKGKYPPTTLCTEMETWEIRECMKRLAEYEDIGLTPEDIIKQQKVIELKSNCFNKMKAKFEQLLKMYEAACEGYVGLWTEMRQYQNSDEPEIIITNFKIESVKKQTPEKPHHDCGGYYCPDCNEWIDEMQVGIAKYCMECGKAIDWEGAKTDE